MAEGEVSTAVETTAPETTSEQSSTTETTEAQATQAAESTEETKGEETEVKPTGRQRILERYSRLHPDRKFKDDDADDDLLGFTADEFDKIDKERESTAAEIKKAREIGDNLRETFKRFPGVAEGYREMHTKGTHPADFLIDNYGDDIIDYLNSDEGKATLKKRREEKVSNSKKKEEMDKLFEENFEVSKKTLKEFAEKNGLSAERAAEHFNRVREVMLDVAMGKFTMDTLQLLYRGENYDKDVAKAKAIGEVNGRNAKIASKLVQSEAAKNRAPSLSGKSLGVGNEDLGEQNGKLKMFGIPIAKKK